MLAAQVLGHLAKYFDLAVDRFTEGDFALATFFAITCMEETAKILVLRAGSPFEISPDQRMREARSHEDKYHNAVINLLTENPRYESFPKQWQDEVWSWFGEPGKLFVIRNNGIYMLFGSEGKLVTPEQVVDVQQAALLVYMSGIALAELSAYEDVPDPGWFGSISEKAEAFRSEFLKQ